MPATKAKNSDWDQISAAFTGVRGVGYVAWYPIAMDAASLSQGGSVFGSCGALEGARGKCKHEGCPARLSIFRGTARNPLQWEQRFDAGIGSAPPSAVDCNYAARHLRAIVRGAEYSSLDRARRISTSCHNIKKR